MVLLSSGLGELVALGAILPFLAVLSNPEQLWQQPWIQPLVLRVGFSQSQQLVLPAVIVFALAAVLAAVIRLLNLWLNGRLAAAVGSDLSCESYRRTLYQPYQVHVQRNSRTLDRRDWCVDRWSHAARRHRAHRVVRQPCDARCGTRVHHEALA